MIVNLFNEKTEVSNLSDAFNTPLKYGDKVIAIDNQGYKRKAYYIGTTPSGHTDKVLPLGSSYLSRPYRGVLKYEWTPNQQELGSDQVTIKILRENDPGVV